ncbi:MAG: alkaline phosphatase family protein [bacterium]|nr:alkaline phosphatase family protein [bacterium]
MMRGFIGTGTRRTAAALLFLAALPSAAGARWVFPQPARFRGEGFHGVAVEGWDYDTNGDGRADWRKLDTDGDGVVDVYHVDRDSDGSFDARISRAERARAAARHLIICVDSVPHALMEELWREGRFRDFNPPSRLISTFPSDTNPAFAEILGTAKTPGIENRYFDRRRNRVTGGARDHLVRPNPRTDRTFHSAFDYEQHPRFGALIYVAPYMVADRDLRAARRTFWRLHRERPADEPIFLYIGSTDAIGHREGREGMRRQLLRLEEMLNEILHATEGDIRVSLFSDHGNNFVPSGRLVDLDGHLARHGFILAGSIRDGRDAVAPRFGLVGAAVLYADPRNRRPLAEALATLEGADFAVFEEGGEAVVIGARGSARISARGDRYACAIEEGDPLALGPIIEAMRGRGEMDDEGFADDASWFEALEGHVYPDVLRRLHEAVHNHVVNVPDVFVSLLDGYCSGSAFFTGAIDLKGTHGSAAAGQTLGIAMGNAGPLPPFIRGSDLMAAIGEPELRRTPPPPTPTGTPTPAPTETPEPAPTETPEPAPTESPATALEPSPPAPTRTVPPGRRRPFRERLTGPDAE